MVTLVYTNERFTLASLGADLVEILDAAGEPILGAHPRAAFSED